MVKIQVLGNGLIPRIGLLAPITEPFTVGRMVAATIIQTSPNLTVNYLNPADGKFYPLTRQNVMSVFDDLEDDDADVKVSAAPVEQKEEAPVESAPVEDKEAVESEKSEPVSEDTESSEPQEDEESVEENEENEELAPVEGRNSKKKNKKR
jgi:hypothetical protein|nr:MAG TPA: hypothetical protein [Caudoviricetes sp.]